jgi:hypothetical protein
MGIPGRWVVLGLVPITRYVTQEEVEFSQYVTQAYQFHIVFLVSYVSSYMECKALSESLSRVRN